jgi:hypothetical protein
MKISFRVDEFERLICTVEDGAAPVTVTASGPDAAAHLVAAIDDAASDGSGECFWPEGGGEYRWMLRRDPEKLRVVVLWCSGTLTGWETVLWTECGLDAFRSVVQAEAARLQPVS